MYLPYSSLPSITQTFSFIVSQQHHLGWIHPLKKKAGHKGAACQGEMLTMCHGRRQQASGDAWVTMARDEEWCLLGTGEGLGVPDAKQ